MKVDGATVGVVNHVGKPAIEQPVRPCDEPCTHINDTGHDTVWQHFSSGVSERRRCSLDRVERQPAALREVEPQSRASSGQPHRSAGAAQRNDLTQAQLGKHGGEELGWHIKDE